MAVQMRQTTFQMDVIGENGTPFRFMYWPKDKVIRYYDRRYVLEEGDPGYGINHTNENGQSCGTALLMESFVPVRPVEGHGMRGWHEVEAWDVDAATMHLVGVWLTHIIERST
jgi:hypothetical protein